MQRNRFLPDMLSTLFDRGRAARHDDDPRSMNELCYALLSKEGDVSGQTLAEVILTRYRHFEDADKLAFFKFLNEELDIDAAALSELAAKYAESKSNADFEQVAQASAAKRRQLLRRLNQPTGATADLVAMRVDLLRLIRDVPELKRTDLDFNLLLRSWFNRGFLVLKQIDWDSPARLLDKIVAYEAVHEIDDLDDLRRRLSPPDRRCFAFFHPAMPDEPLIFVEVALTATIPGSIDALLSEDRETIFAEDAKAAVFYSISNCQQGLKGISFGNLLIKQVAKELAREFPQLTHFVTLSPIPRLNAWLAEQTDDPVATAVLDGTAAPEDLRAIAARYLMTAKGKNGLPFDPVTRFHLGNGAEIHDVHAEADSSENGQKQSSGAMVNYLYDLSRVEKNHGNFSRDGVIVGSKAVTALAKATPKAKPKEVSA
ncbi:malonyl-CoA decarboxylase family protein [Octadecabacter sp. 1_MG-2023]|uniref:malonyl-CoA decarboxylase domain-containing protein n=1 Tax=unclassified Octadecabacter TaxID=196158 RepID=UPI001C0A0C85|nr:MULTISPECIES: malonyl-CoA decarboxylase family protein [unclassified Octadecabacter]MBU2994015.1 malonyl-CoA decarboxylase [Octadecabacter sp. B2R22]MDO6736042.1 malonyl-CoA decarboxylase family protein [Octadecabacter sp. 1_MG-2023]